MTVKQAYEILFGRTDRKINENVVRQELTIEVVKKRYHYLIQKFHPDVINARLKKEPYSEELKELQNGFDKKVSQEITEAKSILSSCLTNKEYVHADKFQILNYYKYIKPEYYMKNEDLIESYKTKLNKANSFRIYDLFVKKTKVIDEYYSLLNYTLSLEDIDNLIKEANEKIEEIENEIDKIKNEYTLLVKKISNSYLSQDEMERLLMEFSQDCYENVNDSGYSDKLNVLEQENFKISKEREKRFYDLKSHITTRLTYAKNIYLVSMQLNVIHFTEDIVVKIGNITEDKNVLVIIKVYQDYIDRQEDLTRKFFNKYNKYLEELNNMSNKEITREYMIQLENNIKNLMTDDNYFRLFNEYSLRELIRLYKSEEAGLEGNKKIINSKLENSVGQIIKIINNKVGKINNIKKIIGEEVAKKEEKYNKKTSLDTLIFVDNSLDKELYNYKRKAIEYYYKYYIYHFVYELKRDYLPKEVSILYNEYKNNPYDLEIIDKCYERFSKVYEKKIDGKVSHVKLSKINSVKSKIISYIQKSRQDNINNGILIPKKLEELYQNIDFLDVDELYKLQEDIDMLYSDRFKLVQLKK